MKHNSYFNPMRVKVAQSVRLFVTLRTIQSMEFSRILEWVALPFSRGFFQPRDPTQLSLPHCRGILYQLSHKGNPKYWSGYPIPSPVDLPHPEIKPVSPALAERFFITEPPGKPDSFISLLQILLFWFDFSK